MKICALPECGIEFEQKHPKHIYHSDRCRYRAKDSGDPEKRQANKKRCAAWYQNPNNRSWQIAKGRARHLARKTSRGEWEMAAPEIGYIPGACMPVALACGYKFEHWQLASLHGMLTRVTGPHAKNNPVFSLFPWHIGCGWAVRIRDIELARSVSMRTFDIDFNNSEDELAIGWLVRVKAPVIKPGAWKLRVEAVTPVHCRQTGDLHYTAPTANNIKGTLDANTAFRLGIKVEPNDVQVRLLDSQAFPDRVALAGNGEKLGEIAGWSGRVDLEVNALGRLLLECAALGMGLGGKTGFGFGRIKVKLLEEACKQQG